MFKHIKQNPVVYIITVAVITSLFFWFGVSYSFLFPVTLNEGIVVHKWHEPERTYLSLYPFTINNGSTTSMIMKPYTIYDGEDFCVKIQGDVDGKVIEQVFYLDEPTYKKIVIGKKYKIDNFSEKDNTLKKERE